MKRSCWSLQARVAAGALALCLGASAVEARSVPPGAQSGSEEFAAHAQRIRIGAAERPPLPTSREHLRADYDRPDETRIERGLSKSATAACDTAAFAAASGSALVDLVSSADLSCLNTLFGLSGTTAGQVFGESKMVAIADAMHARSPAYPGNGSTGMPQLVLFLRAGYYVQYYHEADVGLYGTALRNAIRAALDAFVANAHFDDVNDAHGQVLSEFITLIDSAGENAYGLGAVRHLLDRYDASFDAYWYMKAAVNNTFTVLFRGHYNDDFAATVQGDPAIVATLSAFIDRNAAEVGTDQEYLLSNAAHELGRFLQYPAPLKDNVRPRVRDVLQVYHVTGAGASLWVAAAEMADYYDGGMCAYYGICGFPAQVEQAALPITHQCSSTLRLRAQSLTPEQLAATCVQVAGEETYFHDGLHTNHVALPGDQNSALEMVVFHSSRDYETYSGVLFDNNTNNGGIYLEGDPSQPGNQARFIAYEAEWLRPTFEIWNLTHEYIHYLDGRFDMQGGFSTYLQQPTVWWLEGLAEYFSYTYRNRTYDAAIQQAALHTYALSTVFANDYYSGTTRVYRWGYLSVRFMFERHPASVTQMVGLFRDGNYTGYGQYLGGIGTSLDSEWYPWLACLAGQSVCAANDAVFRDDFERGL